MGADWHQAQMGSDALLHGPCCCTQTLLVGASQPSHPVDDLQRLGGMPLSPDSCTLSACQCQGMSKARSILDVWVPVEL